MTLHGKIGVCDCSAAPRTSTLQGLCEKSRIFFLRVEKTRFDMGPEPLRREMNRGDDPNADRQLQ